MQGGANANLLISPKKMQEYAGKYGKKDVTTFVDTLLECKCCNENILR